jgi:hypothetical protein
MEFKTDYITSSGKFGLLPLVVLLFALSEGRLAIPQISVSPPQTPAQVFTQTISALGGSSAWSGITDSRMTGTCADEDGSNSTAVPDPFVWITAQGEFRYQMGVTATSTVLLSGHGKPSFSSPSANQSLTNETAELLKPFHMPGLVILPILNDSSYRATIVGQEVVLGTATIHIHVLHRLAYAWEQGADQDWWISTSTSLPVKVTYLVPGQSVKSYMPNSYYFSSWSATSGGIAFPQLLLLASGSGAPTVGCTVTQLQLNTQPASSLFEAR